MEFDQSESKITIKTSAKRARFQLKCIDSDKFPQFTASGTEIFEIPIKEFKEMIQQTVFAVSDDETRYFMNGVFFEKAEDKFVMVATDGRRLAYISKEAGAGVKDFPGIIIPPKILNVIIKRSGDEGMISLAVTDKTLFVQFGSYKLSSVLIEGQFPNYRRVIPESQNFSFTVNRAEMLDALRQVSVMVEQKSHRVYLAVAPGIVSVYCEENEIGNARREIPCKYDGGEVAIALNYRYIEEPFKVMDCEEISIHFTEPGKAITIQPVPESDFFHIVMPMQLD
jgi:DNA polymerase-3 subunit beta